VDRPGGYRFVRPILNQAGISYRAMPAFARFLSRLRGSSGLGFTHGDYQSCLPSVTSSFARRFLVEGPGFDFTKDAARTLDRILTGLIPGDAIQTLPGYRIGFWTELLRHFEEPPDKGGRAVHRFPPPAEFLDVSGKRRIAFGALRDFFEERFFFMASGPP
jgi:hypothetical protein